MITRIFHVTDEGTLMYFLVTMFEEIDKSICKEIGISPGFKIINRMSGRVVDSSAGYKFNPDSYDGSIEDQSRKYVTDGTSNAFGILLSDIDNIKKLPETINVQQIREFWVKTSRIIFVDDSIIETIDEYGPERLRKCLYSTPYSKHISLIDISEDKVVFDSGSSMDLKYILPKYLWIPIEEGTIDYLNSVDICSFMKKLLKPE